MAVIERAAVTERATLECYYSQSSPWTYLGGPQLRDIVRRHGARLVLKPFDFHRIAAVNGGIPVRTRPAPRRTHYEEDLRRWSDYLGMPLDIWPRHYPEDGLPSDWNKRAGWMVIAARMWREEVAVAGASGAGVVAAAGAGAANEPAGVDTVHELSHALLRALWAEQRDIADASVRIEVANACGFDGAALQSRERSPEVQAAYEANTLDAERAGVFGAPTIVLEGERFWGQDRYFLVDRALTLRGR